MPVHILAGLLFEIGVKSFNTAGKHTPVVFLVEGFNCKADWLRTDTMHLGFLSQYFSNASVSYVRDTVGLPLPDVGWQRGDAAEHARRLHYRAHLERRVLVP
jgi:hypothetical protein